MTLRFTHAFLAVLLMVAAGARAAEDIRVPFNFRWGDSAQLVENTIDRAQANSEKLSGNVLSAQHILSNRQTREAFG